MCIWGREERSEGIRDPLFRLGPRAITYQQEQDFRPVVAAVKLVPTTISATYPI